MRKFSEIVFEQTQQVSMLRSLVQTVVDTKVSASTNILGALNTGSVARGDARIAPLGILIDLLIVKRNDSILDLAQLLGKDEKPFIPFHCVTLRDNIGLAVEVIQESDLEKIRTTAESNIYAKWESAVIYDPYGRLRDWKASCFNISDDEVKNRSLSNYFRFQYLTGSYRIEKWKHREANIQIAQLFNEACECYCNFIYTINRSFIPRKDWLVYLSYEQKTKPIGHDILLDKLYSGGISNVDIENRYKSIVEVSEWMTEYCGSRGWI